MKKKLRVVVIIACAYFIYIISRGGYYYMKNEGENVPIILSTQFSKVPSSVSLFINDKLYYKNDTLQTFYESFRTKQPLGLNCLRVIIDGETFEESFFVFPVRWIYIEIQKYDIANYKKNEDWVHIDFTSTPTVLM